MSKRYLLLFFSLLNLHLFSQNPDFNQLVDDFYIESKQLIIPGYPHAFNPSIVRYQGKLLLSFRVIPGSIKTFDSLIGLIWLNDEFEAISKPQILDLQEGIPLHSRAEDARLVVVGEKLYMVYSDNRDQKVTKGGFRLHVAKLNFDGERFSVLPSVRLLDYDMADPLRREKNWSPFAYENELHLIYSLEPHRIYRYDGTSSCKTVGLSYSSLEWPDSILRGGTPALPIDNERYLSFFHSFSVMASEQSKNVPIDHYFMGAYTFSREAPFEILQVSPRPIIGQGFYEGPYYKPYWKPALLVVFPGGFVFDDQHIWVVFGKQDHEAWVVKFDKEALLKSLCNVNSLR